MARDPVTGAPHAYADRALHALVRTLTAVPKHAASTLTVEAVHVLRTAARRAAEGAHERHIRDDLYAVVEDLNDWLPPIYPPAKEPRRAAQ